MPEQKKVLLRLTQKAAAILESIPHGEVTQFINAAIEAMGADPAAARAKIRALLILTEEE